MAKSLSNIKSSGKYEGVFICNKVISAFAVINVCSNGISAPLVFIIPDLIAVSIVFIGLYW